MAGSPSGPSRRRAGAHATRRAVNRLSAKLGAIGYGLVFIRWGLVISVGRTPRLDDVEALEQTLVHEGLLPPPGRTPSGYRAFDDDAVERLRFIKGAQRIGLRLQEIKELLDIRDRGLCPCGHTEDLLSRRVSEIDAEITGLQETREDLIAFTERFSAIECPEGVEPWPCAKEFIAAADGLDGR